MAEFPEDWRLIVGVLAGRTGFTRTEIEDLDGGELVWWIDTLAKARA